jgi:hypothetical protein
MTGHTGHVSKITWCSPPQDKQLKIRIHGSRKKGGVLQSDVIASNGIIHIINKLMDSVSPTVESDKEVHKYQRQRLRHKRHPIPYLVHDF